MKRAKDKYMINRTKYKDIKRYDHQQMEDFLTDVYKNGYVDGKESVTGVELQDVEAALKDVKGIGPVVWNRIQERLAELFRRRMNHDKEKDIISTTKILEDGKSVRRYDLVPTIQAYIKYLSDKAYGKQHRTDKEIELREQKMQADIALKESQGELHRLKTEIAAGQYISVEEVKLDYAKFFVVFKKFVMSIPARVTGMLSGQMEPSELRRCEKEIAAEVNRLLGAFVVAGIVGPEDVKKDGTLKKEKNPDS